MPFCIFTHYLNVWVVSTFWILRRMKLWIFMFWCCYQGRSYGYSCVGVVSILCLVWIFMFSFVLGIHLRVESLNPLGTLWWTPWRTAEQFSRVATLSNISISIYDGSNFSTFLPTLTIVRLFGYSHLYMSEILSHCGLDLHLPNDYVEHLFTCLLVICTSLE